MLRENGDCFVKIVMIGNTFVGKSSLMERFDKDSCEEKRLITVGTEFLLTRRRVFGIHTRVQFWDQAGNERYRTTTRAYYEGAHWLIIMYDVTNSDSFENVSTKWLKEIETYKLATRKLLIGNKSDLESLRTVKREDGQQLANEIGALFYEISTKTGANCEECMMDIISQALWKINEQ